MTDKIITTFETTITWFSPSNISPSENMWILVKYKNDDRMFSEYFSNDTEDGFILRKWETAVEYQGFQECEMWAPLPKFGDEQ